MSEMEAAAWYPIGAVARKTGLTVHTLRAWERRYSLVSPQRSAGGTRLYSNTDISRLRLLRRATQAGFPISQIAGLDLEALRTLLRNEGLEPASSPSTGQLGASAPDRMVDDILRAVELMDGEGIHRELMRAVVALPVPKVVDEVLVPTLREVGDRWAAGAFCPANEHLLTVHVRRVLAWLTDAVPLPGSAPTLVATTPAGHWHELGAQIAGLLATQEGWRVIFLGPNLPARDIARAVSVTDARILLLGVSIPDEALLPELQEIRKVLPPEVEIIIGGRAADSYGSALADLGIELLPDFGSLTAALRDRRAAE